MSELALPGVIEPAARKGPDLSGAINPITGIIFGGIIAAVLLFVAYSIYTDIGESGTKVTTYAHRIEVALDEGQVAQARQEWRLVARAAQWRQTSPDRQIRWVQWLLQEGRMGAGHPQSWFLVCRHPSLMPLPRAVQERQRER